ncbi:MAG: type II toxin-antitoxin system RelE/ParE family toxin [Psychroflexus sp.]|jgi:plasmid stabilization system protein ParE|nr:type II toxin-antitoxin system RelE/ParE family toxin [Psychroflexus sp.]
MDVYLSDKAASKLADISDYLLESFGLRVRDEFFRTLSEKILQITNHPESCPKSNKFKNLYKCVLTKQTIFITELNGRTMKLRLSPSLII